jgi:hypothetical protein
VPNGVFVFTAIFALADNHEKCEFPVLGSRTTTWVHDDAGKVIETHDYVGGFRDREHQEIFVNLYEDSSNHC